MKVLRFFISGVFLLSCSLLFCAPGRKSLEIISVNEGLSQSFVNCIFQDHQGFLWAGTYDGLNKYDGYGFQIFRADKSKTASLSDNYITAITEDYEGNLWIGTSHGLNRLLVDEGIFQQFHHNDTIAQSLAEEAILDLLPSTGKSILIKTENYLQQFYYEENRYITFRFPTYHDLYDIGHTASALYIDAQKVIYVGTRDGLLVLDRDTMAGNSFGPMRHFNIGEVSSIVPSQDGNIWIGSSTGLYQYRLPAHELTSCQHLLKNAPGVNWNIKSLCADKTGRLWIGMTDGIYLLDLPAGEITVFRSTEYLNNILLLNNITSIIEDRTGLIWFSTWNGMAKVNPMLQNFVLYNKNPGSIPDLSGLNVASLLVDKKNRIWVATWGNGVDVIDRKSLSYLAHYSSLSRTKATQIPVDNVNYLYLDWQNRLWLATRRGMLVSEPGGDEFRPFESVFQPGTDMLQLLSVNYISQDNRGNYLIASSSGAYLYEPENKYITVFRNDQPEVHRLLDSQVLFAYEDKEGYYWFGTFSGLSRWDPRSDRMTHFSSAQPDIRQRLSSDLAGCLYEDRNGNLWVGTDNGLNEIDASQGVVRIFSKANGLPEHNIYAITGDDHGKLWMSTHHGITCFDPATVEFRYFDVTDGLQNSEFNQNSMCKTPGGEIFFGGVMGFNSFHPDSLVLNDIIPETRISYVEVVKKGQKELIYPSRFDRLIIPAWITSFSIHYSSLDFTNPQQNLYKYKMEGVDEDYIDAGSSSSVNFTNLPYGRYTFYVYGSNNDQFWCREPARLDIFIRSSIYQTRLAIFAYIFLTLGLFYAFIRYRTYNLRKSNQLLREKELAAIEIARQKEELSIKNRNITDSIIYAQKIQEAMLPSMNLFKQILPDSFIFYKPKDIVSGDFYWINKKNDKAFVAAVDCTGHGVPGALMSMIGSELIRNIINMQHVEEPARILERLNKGIADSFNKEVERIMLKDGMDLSLCSIDLRKGVLEFAGAFNSAYLVRQETITELKADRCSVGLAEDHMGQNFTNHLIPLEENDIIYLFTDGYADQFGGPKEKKFMYRRFRHLLLTIHKLTMEQQRIILEETIEDWRGGHDQIDDILIIGFKPSISR